MRVLARGVMASSKLVNALKQRRKRYQNMDEEKDNLSLWMKVTYSAPTLSTLPVTVLLAIYLNSFYESLGVGLAYISFYIALARSFDVVSDPAMSYITDSTRSQFGRRRPYMLLGCLPYAGLLWGLLHPPVYWLGTALPTWFGTFYILFFLSSTFTTIPYDALGPEMTDNYDDRSNLFFVSSIFDATGSLLAVLVPQFLAYFFLLPRQDFEATAKSVCYDSSGEGMACYKEYDTVNFLRYNISAHVPGFFSDAAAVKDTFDPTLLECDLRSAEDDDSNLAEGYQNYCDCYTYCKDRAYLTSNRFAYSICGFMYGAWFVVTMVHAVYHIRERSQLKGKLSLPKAPPLVPMLLNTLRNRAFVGLLPAWVLDAMAQSIVASMCVYYVRYVIQPEYTDECLKPENQENWECNSLKVLGAGVTFLLIAALVACPIWLFVLKKVGKVKAWLLWSCTMAFTNILLLIPQKGQVWPFIGILFINGLPFSAKFLADAILSDVIDYDEFLSGQRSEATYTMFKGFLPKICAIPALAVPLAILNAIGHVPPEVGSTRPEQQPAQIRVYCIIVSVILPTVLSIASWYIKSKFPLQTKEQIDKISHGVALHLQGMPSEEPITGVSYRPFQPAGDQEKEIVELLDAFPSLEVVLELENNSLPNTMEVFVERVKMWRNRAVALMMVLLVSSILSYTFLIEDQVLSVVPIISIIGFGISITYLGFCHLRLGYARRLAELDVTNNKYNDLLQRVVQHRRKLDMIYRGEEAIAREKKSKTEFNLKGLEDEPVRDVEDVSVDVNHTQKQGIPDDLVVEEVDMSEVAL